MSTAQLLSRLRVSGMPASDQEIEAVKRALRDGVDMLRRAGKPKPSLAEVIWELVKDAAKTEARIPNRERGWLRSCDRSMWVELARTREECRQVEWEQQLGLLQNAMEQVQTPMPKLAITDPAAISRWLVVYDWLKFINSSNSRRPDRDVAVFLLRARGISVREIGRMLRGSLGDRAIDMIKDRVLRHLVIGVTQTFLDGSEYFGILLPRLGEVRPSGKTASGALALGDSQ